MAVHVRPVRIVPTGLKTPAGFRYDHQVNRLAFQPVLELLKGTLTHTSRVPMEDPNPGFVLGVVHHLACPCVVPLCQLERLQQF